MSATISQYLEQVKQTVLAVQMSTGRVAVFCKMPSGVTYIREVDDSVAFGRLMDLNAHNLVGVYDGTLMARSTQRERTAADMCDDIAAFRRMWVSPSITR